MKARGRKDLEVSKRLRQDAISGRESGVSRGCRLQRESRSDFFIQGRAEYIRDAECELLTAAGPFLLKNARIPAVSDILGRVKGWFGRGAWKENVCSLAYLQGWGRYP